MVRSKHGHVTPKWTQQVVFIVTYECAYINIYYIHRWNINKEDKVGNLHGGHGKS